MDCLALRKTGGLITGDIRVNGFPQRGETFTRIMGCESACLFRFHRLTCSWGCEAVPAAEPLNVPFGLS